MNSAVKIITPILALFLILLFLHIFSYDTFAQISTKIPQPYQAHFNNLFSASSNKVNQVLGVQTTDFDVNNISDKITQSEEFKSAQTKATNSINQALKELSTLPEKQKEKLKKEIKKKICEEWLKE